MAPQIFMVFQLLLRLQRQENQVDCYQISLGILTCEYGAGLLELQGVHKQQKLPTVLQQLDCLQ